MNVSLKLSTVESRLPEGSSPSPGKAAEGSNLSKPLAVKSAIRLMLCTFLSGWATWWPVSVSIVKFSWPLKQPAISL